MRTNRLLCIGNAINVAVLSRASGRFIYGIAGSIKTGRLFKSPCKGRRAAPRRVALVSRDLDTGRHTYGTSVAGSHTYCHLAWFDRRPPGAH